MENSLNEPMQKKPCFHTHISSVAFVSFPNNNECDRITEGDRS